MTRCFNSVKFFGNYEVHKKVSEWRSKLYELKLPENDVLIEKVIRDTFYPDISKDIPLDFGTSWLMLDDGTMSIKENGIGFISEGNPPNELLKKIACLLFDADKNVIVTNLYTLGDGSVGISYSTPYDKKSAYFEDAFVDLNEYYEKYEDSQEAEEQSDLRLADLELEYLYDMMSDMPGTQETVKKYMGHLDVDWESFEEN